MNMPVNAYYTNEVSQEYLRSQDTPGCRPAIAIFRYATEGSQTRNGGVVRQASTPWEITLDNGQTVRVAQKGDEVMYADGSTAQIITGTGEDNDHVALVGSLLSNGDEIINTLQRQVVWVAYEGEPLAADFLPSSP